MWCIKSFKTNTLFQVASKYWAPQTIGNHMEFDGDIVDQIYQEEIQGARFMIRRIMMLEFSQYLENYLWPNYRPGSSSAYHVLSIVIMVNEKFRERVSAWQVLIVIFITFCVKFLARTYLSFYLDLSKTARQFSKFF